MAVILVIIGIIFCIFGCIGLIVAAAGEVPFTVLMVYLIMFLLGDRFIIWGIKLRRKRKGGDVKGSAYKKTMGVMGSLFILFGFSGCIVGVNFSAINFLACLMMFSIGIWFFVRGIKSGGKRSYVNAVKETAGYENEEFLEETPRSVTSSVPLNKAAPAPSARPPVSYAAPAAAQGRKGVSQEKRNALSDTESKELLKTIQNQIAKLVNKKAAALQKNDPETAIEILEKTVALVESNEIKSRLGELLTERSITSINEARENDGDDTLAILEREVVNLERAAKLGSKRAADNLEAAKNILKSAREDMGYSLREARQAVKQADIKAASHDLGGAIRILEDVLKKTREKGDQARIKKKIAAYLNTRAVETANRIQGMLQKKMDQEISRMGIVKGLGNQGMGNLFGGLYGYGEYHTCNVGLCSSQAAYKVTLEGYGEIYLCYSHYNRLHAIMDGAHSLGSKTRAEIVSAKKDLIKAYKYEKSELVKKNLREVEKIAVKVAYW
ncbi:MAG: hypothetical protein PHO15_06800 [Eubacteriales bacterium]|nr:hypothetical protein [Eubacteriales bacterium]